MWYELQIKSALFVATLTSFMGPFTISSVNVALPTIQTEFSADAILLNYSEFLKSVRVSFLIFSLMCMLGILFSLMRGELRKEDQNI